MGGSGGSGSDSEPCLLLLLARSDVVLRVRIMTAVRSWCKLSVVIHLLMSSSSQQKPIPIMEGRTRTHSHSHTLTKPKQVKSYARRYAFSAADAEATQERLSRLERLMKTASAAGFGGGRITTSEQLLAAAEEAGAKLAAYYEMEGERGGANYEHGGGVSKTLKKLELTSGCAGGGAALPGGGGFAAFIPPAPAPHVSMHTI